MKKHIQKTISTIYDENNNIIETNEVDTVILFPEEGMTIRNKITGEIINATQIGVGTDDSENNYEDYKIEK